jgi:hypothetical protein
MRRLIENLGIAVITFILGLFALDLWNTLHPPKFIYPKQMVISEKQYHILLTVEQASQNPQCHETEIPAWLEGESYGSYCAAREKALKLNCP